MNVFEFIKGTNMITEDLVLKFKKHGFMSTMMLKDTNSVATEITIE